MAYARQVILKRLGLLIKVWAAGLAAGHDGAQQMIDEIEARIARLEKEDAA